MKNLHVLPTPNPSRVYKDLNNRINITDIEMKSGDKQNIYITNDEDIKEGDWCLDKFNQIWKLENKKLIAFDSQGIKRFSTHNILGHEPKKIILTTDQDLIKDGVQSIDDEFLEWFVKNLSCEEIEVENIPNNSWGFDLEEPMNLGYKIIIPKEEPNTVFVTTEQATRMFGTKKLNKMLKESRQKLERDITITNIDKQETLEEAINREFPFDKSYKEREAMFIGAKWQQEKSYSEVELLQLLVRAVTEEYDNLNDWFEQFKKK